MATATANFRRTSVFIELVLRHVLTASSSKSAAAKMGPERVRSSCDLHGQQIGFGFGWQVRAQQGGP